jgi:hypothetical protein
MKSRNDSLAANEEFDAELKRRWGDTPMQQIAVFARHARRTRRNEVVLGLVLAVVAGLTIYVIHLGWQSNTTATEARTIAEQAAHTQVVNAARAQCVQSNTTRAEEEEALKKVVSSLVPPGVTLPPAAQAQIDRINASISAAYAPRDCTHIQASTGSTTTTVGGSRANNGKR